MAYGIRDGDIISLDNPKAGALTLSVPFQDYQDRTEVSPENMWRTMTAVRSVVNFKAKSIAGVPFQLYEHQPDGGREKVRDGDLAKTLKQPMPRSGQTRFVEQLMFDMSIYGRWMFLVEPSAVGLKFLRLPAEKCAIGVSPAGEYDRLWISTGEGWKWVPLDNVVFDISFGPTPRGDKARGWSDVDTLGELALELTQLGDYRRELFKNQAMVPAVVERPAGAKWSDEAWKRFKTDIASYRAGGPNAGGWPVLEDGMQLKPIQVMDPSKAEYVQVRELSLTEAAQALNIPPELVGAREGTNSNILALREQLYVDVLGPDISSFQEALNAGLEKFMTPDQYIEVNFDAKLRGSLNDRAKIYQSAGGAPWLTVNEIRAMENRPALEGGDELIRPLNVTEGGQANPQDSAPDDNGQDEKDGTLSREPDRKAVEPRPKVRGRSAAHRITADHFDELNKACETYEQNLLDFWHGYTKRMARRMGIDLKGRDHRGKAIPVYPGTDILRAETALLEGTILSSSRVVAKAGSDLVLNNWNPDMTGFAYDKQENWLKKVAKTASGQFEHQMAKTYADGLGQDMNNWGDAIAEQYNDDSSFMSWATGGATETASFAGEDAARASGVTHKRWVTQSKNPRDSHKGQSGMLIEMDDYFPNGQKFPGDWEGGADEVVNCFPAETFVQGVPAGAYRRFYSGPMVKIVTAEGEELTGTPNHPILTDQGWVPLEQITEGHNLVRYRQHGDAAISHDVNGGPSQIGKVFDSLSMAGDVVRVDGSRVDFHGDLSPSDVDVVLPDRQLRDYGETTADKFVRQFLLAPADADTAVLVADRTLGERFGSIAGATAGSIRRAGQEPPFLAGELAVADPLGGSLASRLDPLAEEERAEAGAADPVLASESLLGLAGEVFTDHVVRIERDEAWEGHVYNLSTETGAYAANSIVVHNCQCRLDYEKPNELHPSPLKEIGQTLFQNFLVPAVESYLAPALAPGTYPALTSGTGTALETFNMLAIGGRPVLPLEAAASFSDNQVDAFLEYTSGKNEEINAMLRNPASIFNTPENRELSDTLRGALKTQVFQEDTFLRRNIWSHHFNDVLEQSGGDWTKLKGLTIRDDGFLSTTEYAADFDGGVFGNTTINIMAPKGTRGAYIGEYSTYGDMEREVLLAPGNSMQILDAKQRKDGSYEVDVVLDQDGA